MDKKGFSLVELMAAVTIIGILSAMGVMAVSRAIVSSQKKTYKNYENQMIGAAKNYLTTHTDDVIVGTQKITLKTLQDNGYIENLVDPKSKHNCDADKSYVEVVSSQSATAFNINFQYAACLCCVNASYQTYDSKKNSTLDRHNRCDTCWS